MTSLLFSDAFDPGHGKACFDIADTSPLRVATFLVLRTWQENGWQPGAEKWQSDTRYWRPMLIDAIRKEWQQILGGDQAVFPWHDDFVMLAWVATRKMNLQQKREMCEFYGADIPDEWKAGKELGKGSEQKDGDA